jgi:hypothetical protein
VRLIRSTAPLKRHNSWPIGFETRFSCRDDQLLSGLTMPIPSSDDSRPDTFNNRQSNRRISQEIANLQQDIRDDFDQKLRELSGLMHKFKSLLGHDAQPGSVLPLAANQPTLEDETTSRTTIGTEVLPDPLIDQQIEKNISDALAHIPVLTDRVTDEISESATSAEQSQPNNESAIVVDINKNAKDREQKEPPVSEASAADTVERPEQKRVSGFSTEPARFETGLYQLNSQLYRFKLELDQELEYREEPLHIHFRHQSELAKVLKQITEKMQQEKNAGR